MGAVRSLISLSRVLGLVALAAAVYWLVFPTRLSALLGGDEPAAGNAVSMQAPAQGTEAKPGKPAVAALPKEVAAAAAIQMPAASKASPPQARVAQWLGSKYRVSPAAIEILVVEADLLARHYRFSPNLLMAIMAIESNFHPYIQSEAGAQGLMQVMPVIHAKRYEKFGGKAAFLDPVVSLKVGAEILHDFVKLKGSETEALRFYFGGGASSDAYIDKVRAEQRLLNRVAAGARVPVE